MPSTHLSLYYHLIFSTKSRQRVIFKSWRPRLHEFLGGTVRTLGGKALEVGGTLDHVHLLVGLRAIHRLSDVLREIKQASSQWVHETLSLKTFAWQEGYAALTVSKSAIENVAQYIRAQEEHHRTRTFQEEYLKILKENGIDYDERYLW